MTQRPRTDLGFVKLSDSYFVLENPEQDIRGKDVYDVYGEQMPDGLALRVQQPRSHSP